MQARFTNLGLETLTSDQNCLQMDGQRKGNICTDYRVLTFIKNFTHQFIFVYRVSFLCEMVQKLENAREIMKKLKSASFTILGPETLPETVKELWSEQEIYAKAEKQQLCS